MPLGSSPTKSQEKEFWCWRPTIAFLYLFLFHSLLLLTSFPSLNKNKINNLLRCSLCGDLACRPLIEVLKTPYPFSYPLPLTPYPFKRTLILLDQTQTITTNHRRQHKALLICFFTFLYSNGNFRHNLDQTSSKHPSIPATHTCTCKPNVLC